MKTATKIAAQGDVMFVRINEIPPDATLKYEGSQAIVAHSETGHHHIAEAERVRLYGVEDPMVCYLVNETGQYTDIIHQRPHDTHETLRLDGPMWKIVRQREATPEGWRRVED